MLAQCSDKEEASSLKRKKAFATAKKCISTGPVFRFFMFLYAERKMVLLFLCHFASTMIVWSHFGLIKFQEQENKVPAVAHRYWAKRLIPPIEFGSMHAILFQMALIPLTMCRYSIARLSNSFLNRFIPLNRTLHMHIHFGYTMVLIVFLATIVFFIFFGLLCSEGEQAFCDKFTSEIMCTGYGILGCLLLIAGTAYFRFKIPYELFYAVHFLMLVMYSIAIAHTIDNVQRSGMRERSQNFRWFSASLLFYFCDYAIMYINQRYLTNVISYIAVEGGGGSRMTILKLRRPELFSFQPGQYAFLKVSQIDRHWHPFSIASDPSSSSVEFYIEVFGEKSWTQKLWNRLQAAEDRENFTIEIMGPYGTGFIEKGAYTNVLAIGAGTGIVPIVSVLKEHIQQKLLLDPEMHLVAQQEHEKAAIKKRSALEENEGSIFSKCMELLCQKKIEEQGSKLRSVVQSRKIERLLSKLDGIDGAEKDKFKVKEAVDKVTRFVYFEIFILFLTVYAATIFSLLISWNTISINLYGNMLHALKLQSLLLHICFGLLIIFLWKANGYFSYLDLVFTVISFVSDAINFRKYNRNEVLLQGDLLLTVAIVGYIAVRLWCKTTQPSRWRPSSVGRKGGQDSLIVNTIDKLDLVWISRSATLIAQILPDINSSWDTLANRWGDEYTLEVLQISVYVTDRDEKAVELLKQDISNMTIYKKGWVHFGRPKLEELIENHTIEMIDKRQYSSTLLAFCGSPVLSHKIQEIKTSNELTTTLTGHGELHHMNFISESYGSPKSSKAKDKLEVGVVAMVETDTEASTALERWAMVKKEARRIALAVRVYKAFMDYRNVDDDIKDVNSMIESYREKGNLRRKSIMLEDNFEVNTEAF